jgi:hypothetical protein
MTEPAKPAFDDEAREKLKERLDAIHAARKPIQTAKAPLDEALRALDALHDAAVEEAGVELLDEACESCDRLLIKGDRGHRCSDGPVLCEACSPTWADILRQYQEPDFAPDDPAEHEKVRALVVSMCATGQGDEKNLEAL